MKHSLFPRSVSDGCGRGAGPRLGQRLRRVCSMVGLDPSLPVEWDAAVGARMALYLLVLASSNCRVIAQSMFFLMSSCPLLDNPSV